MKLYHLAICLILLPACKQASDNKNKIAADIAEANGIENFNKVKSIEFTFNVKRDTAAASSRHWKWFPQTNEAVFITDSATTKFKRTDTSTEELRKLNAQFTNDEYWLLFPYHLKWDTGFELEDSSMKTGPVTGKSLRKITIRYNDKDGFTPGDMYDVYVDKDLRINEWTFHKGGTPEPSLMTTWENYKDFNGLQIAQEHKTKDGQFSLYFTGIRVEK